MKCHTKCVLMNWKFSDLFQDRALTFLGFEFHSIYYLLIALRNNLIMVYSPKL